MTEQQWTELVSQHPEANFLQSWQWGELHERLGSKVIMRTVEVDGQAVGVWQGIVKNAKRGRYLEVPGGPLVNWCDQMVVEKTTADLREVAKREKVAFVRIRPQEEESDKALDKLAQAGYKKAPFHLHAEHTNILDLSPSEEDLLANMRRQTRYEVKRADKKGVEVSWQTGEEAIDEFYDLQQQTAKRQGFIASSRRFLETLAAVFGKDLRIYRAEADGQLLNLALVIIKGQEIDYFEAASTLEARQYPGSYALLWQVIRDGKELGQARCNLWGIAYTDDPKHRYAGVTTFKRGFGGRDVAYLPAHDLVINRWRYALNWIIETIRRKKRKL